MYEVDLMTRAGVRVSKIIIYIAVEVKCSPYIVCEFTASVGNKGLTECTCTVDVL